MRKVFSSRPLRSLATRINLLVFVTTMASSMAVSWISLQSLDNFFKARVDQRFPELARRISTELDHWYSLRTRELEVFAESSILVDSLSEMQRDDRRGQRARDEVKQYLGYVLGNFPHFDRLVVSGPTGETLLEVGGVDALPEGMLGAHRSGDSGTSISRIQLLGDRKVQVASMSMHGAAGVGGQLHALIDMSELVPILSTDELGYGARAFLVDGEMRYLNPPEGLSRDARYDGPESPGDSGTGGATIHHDEHLDMRVVSAQVEIPRFGWRLVVEQSYDEVFAPVAASMSRAIALNSAIILACCLGALRLARSIIRPLHALAEGARRLSAGEREVEIAETPSSEEVQLLTRTFNEMSRTLGTFASELEESHREVEASNEELVSKNLELSRVNLVLEQLSITDGLTKLHNHRYFHDSMHGACRRSLRTKEPLSLLLIDIDNFKRWNDRLGHAGGDEILRGIAEVLTEQVRETDLLARYGGEEFAVLALDTTLEGATELAEKLRETVASSNLATEEQGQGETLSVSIGVAEFSGDQRKLFADADEALYRAKDSGRDCVVATERVPHPTSADSA